MLDRRVWDSWIGCVEREREREREREIERERVSEHGSSRARVFWFASIDNRHHIRHSFKQDEVFNMVSMCVHYSTLTTSFPR
jgi:hypothetical protein